MSLFLLPLALLFILVALLLVLLATLVRAVRSALILRHASFQVTPDVVRPGEGLRVWARVEPRRGRPVVVRAALTCTMFDHRAKKLYSHQHTLAPMFDRRDELVVFAEMPPYALKSGAVGDELSKLFSEDAHRLLVFWSVDYEVALAEAPDIVLARASINVDVPEGRALRADRGYMEQLIVDTCRAMQSDLVLNWLVKLAGADGTVHPAERALLHQVLRDAHGVVDPSAADARIAVELTRDLDVDATFLQKHLPPEARIAFYRFLYAMAWRDGHLDGREHNFLVSILDKFGLDPRDVTAVEREVMFGLARHA